MKRLLLWCFLVPAALALLAGAVVLAVLEDTPLVARATPMSPASVAQARQLLATHDPRRLRPGERRTVDIPVALLDAGASHLATRLGGGRGAFALTTAGAELRLTVPVFRGSRYLNVKATIVAEEGTLRVAGAAVGALAVPPRLVAGLAQRAVALAGYEHEWRLARQALRRVEFRPTAGTVAVSYLWQPEILARARSLALPADDLARLHQAQERLAALLDHRAARARVPLVDVLQPMLAAGGEDPHPQRRAALLVLAAYLAERNLGALAPEAGRWRAPRRLELTLRDRHDTAQHFVISAALAAWADQPVAEAIGLYKELQDARHGSGFSFADLAADQAGTRFGELVARRDPRLDAALAAPLPDGVLMPPLEGLPEFLHEREFRRRFGGPESPAYQRVMDDIAARLRSLPLYR